MRKIGLNFLKMRLHTENLSTWNVVIKQSSITVLFKYDVARITKRLINYK